MAESQSLYSILGVAGTATAEEIEAAYSMRRAALEGRGGDSADEISLLRVAHDTLKNPALRQRYDRRQAALSSPMAKVTAMPTSVEMTFGRRPSRRIWSLPFLMLGVGLAYWWLRPQAPVRSAPPIAARSAPVAPASTPAQPEQDAPLDIALPPLPPPPPPPRTEADAGRAPAAPIRVRPQRQPGFDTQYLAWSDFFVIRPGAVTGSGVMVAPNKILTNCHVLAGAGLSGIAVLHSMTRKPTRVTEYARLDDDDACLLHAPGAGDYAVEWGNSADLKPGDMTHTFGHPGGSIDVVWSTGNFVQRMPTKARGEDFLVTTNYCRPGSSGGPLFDNEGRLVGVVMASQRLRSEGREVSYGNCAAVTEATARELLRKPLFPIVMAPAEYKQNY
jgi:serine protease Do